MSSRSSAAAVSACGRFSGACQGRLRGWHGMVLARRTGRRLLASPPRWVAWPGPLSAVIGGGGRPPSGRSWARSGWERRRRWPGLGSVLASSALAAALGWAAERLTGAGPVAVGAAAGAAAGALGLRPQKVALGPLVGAAVEIGRAHV